MTSFAFILGCLPLAFAAGAGAVARRVMGSCIIGGMLAASLIAVFLIPVMFYVVERARGAKQAERKTGRGEEGMSRPKKLAAATAALVMLLAGCAVGPDYRKPEVPMPDNFRGAPASAAAQSLADLPWWDIYKDETLTGLIRAALSDNFDLRVAVTRVEQARAVAARRGRSSSRR